MKRLLLFVGVGRAFGVLSIKTRRFYVRKANSGFARPHFAKKGCMGGVRMADKRKVDVFCGVLV